MCSAGDNAALPALGFPIRASTGQRLFSASPWLIAAVHALLQLLVPRHPPCALNILTVIMRGDVRRTRNGDTRFSAAAYRWRLMWLLCSFQGPRRGFYAGRSARCPPTSAGGTPTGGRRSLKTQQHAGRFGASPDAPRRK